MRHAAGLVVFGLILAVGCAPPPKKRQFNNILAKLNVDLSTSAKAFQKTVAPLEAGAAVSPNNVRSAADNCKKALKDVQEVFDDTSSPVGSVSARTMRSKYADFLKTQHTIYSDCFVRIVEIVEANKGRGGWDKIGPLLKRADDLEKDAYDALVAAQREFGEKHGYQTK